MDEGTRGVRSTAHLPKGVPTRLRPADAIDVLVAMVLVLVGTFAALVLPEGNTPRLLLALPVLFFAPGYLLIQAALGARSFPASRPWHAALALGVSPAVVGLFALMTALVPGGFRVTPIVLSVTVGSIAFTLLAMYRRTGTPAGAATGVGDVGRPGRRARRDVPHE